MYKKERNKEETSVLGAKGATLCAGADVTEVGTVVREAVRKSGVLTASCVTLGELRN